MNFEKIKSVWHFFEKFHFSLVIASMLFLLLLVKNPFSERTLIPNFEPFPDTFHYVTSARSFLAGFGLNLVREGRILAPNVPPLYSVTLVPLFAIYNDPRVFYFTNVILSLASLTLFYLIIKKIIKNIWIIGLVLFLYVTNYFLYWYPTLAMAENLILPLFLSAVFLLISPPTKLKTVFAGFLAIAFYATKYAAAPLTVIFLFCYGLKILSAKQIKKDYSFMSLFIFSFLFGVLLFFGYEYTAKGQNIFSPLVSFIAKIAPKFPVGESQLPSGTPTFSMTYLATNLPQYLGAITGKPMKFLWDQTPIVPTIFAIPGLIGLLVGLFYKNFRFLSAGLLFMLFGKILFISTFYSADARFIFPAIPTLLIGFALFLSFIFDFLEKKQFKFLFYTLFFGLFIFYSAANAVRFKNQTMLNLKYAETPWYYISVKKLNQYFTQGLIKDNKKPVVISALPPYLIDFYSNGNYTLLPLSSDQDFRNQKEIVWGSNDYSDLPRLYAKYIQNGYPVYVAKYGLGNEGYLHNDYRKIEEKFQLTQVVSGCYELCNVYKLELKDSL